MRSTNEFDLERTALKSEVTVSCFFFSQMRIKTLMTNMAAMANEEVGKSLFSVSFAFSSAVDCLELHITTLLIGAQTSQTSSYLHSICC